MKLVVYSSSLVLLPTCFANVNNLTCANGTTFDEKFPNITVVVPAMSVWPGNQNLTYCCVQAVTQYLNAGCQNDSNVKVDEQILNRTRQFSCGATFTGDLNGAPLVQVSYSWSKRHCRGWQVSARDNLTQWLEVLVGFLLPSVVFSLNVPRRKKFLVSDELFMPRLRDVLLLPYAVVAIVIAGIDTIVWLCTVFAMAAPLLFSGIHEAWLDLKIIDHLNENSKEWARLPLALRARLLFAILAGNLDLFPAWTHIMSLARDLDELDHAALSTGSPSRSPSPAVNTPTLTEIPDKNGNIPINGERGPSNARLSPNSALSGRSTAREPEGRPSEATHRSREFQLPGTSDGQSSRSSNTSNDILSEQESYWPLVLEEVTKRINSQREDQRRRDEAKRLSETVGKIDTRLAVRLQAMLGCQYSFGSTIGGPVLFYVGSFTYALIEIQQAYGNDDVAHALAFGCWWMVIPHIATISGLLLGGNNPNTLAVIIGAKEAGKLKYVIGAPKPNSNPPHNHSEPVLSIQVPESANPVNASREQKTRRRPVDRAEREKFRVLDDVYESVYKSTSMWNRGKSKQEWLLVLCVDSWSSYEDDKEVDDRVKEQVLLLIKDIIILNPLDWLLPFSLTLILLAVPCILGWITSFYTPEVGLSCRSLTFTIYLAVQVVLLGLWALETTWLDDYWRLGRRIKRLDRLDRENGDFNHVDREFMHFRSLAMADTRRSSSVPRPKDIFDRLKHFIFTSARREINDLVTRYNHTLGKTTQIMKTDDGTTANNASPTLLKATTYGAYYVACLFVLAVAVFTAIGGTLMQIMGVFRSCLCKTNARNWASKTRGNTLLYMSTNDRASIKAASHHWSIIGSVSVGFLVVVAYVGWWYQKGVRARFKHVAAVLGEDIQERKKDLENDS